MTDVKEIRKKLWRSLDMFCVKKYLIEAGILYGLSLLMLTKQMPAEFRPIMTAVVFCLLALPVLIFCLWRSFRIFKKADAYIFCQAVLDRPKAGSLRDTMYFTVVLDRKYVVDTHSIFQIRSFVGPVFENYVNQTVAIAYNEATQTVVVIG